MFVHVRPAISANPSPNRPHIPEVSAAIFAGQFTGTFSLFFPDLQGTLQKSRDFT